MRKNAVYVQPGDCFGRLTVIKELQPPNKERWILCKCSCGQEKKIRLYNLTKGNIRSCGCLRRERVAEQNYKHGFTTRKDGPDRLYKIWSSMKARCLNPNIAAYPRYGGRGIKICDEWLNSYTAFRTWALSNGYNDTLSIDRIDNDKGYSPENCRWADRVTQQNNRSFNHKVTFNNETHTFAEWEKITGIKQVTIRQRLSRGLPMEQVFFDGNLKERCRL